MKLLLSIILIIYAIGHYLAQIPIMSDIAFIFFVILYISSSRINYRNKIYKSIFKFEMRLSRKIKFIRIDTIYNILLATLVILAMFSIITRIFS